MSDIDWGKSKIYRFESWTKNSAVLIFIKKWVFYSFKNWNSTVLRSEFFYSFKASRPNCSKSTRPTQRLWSNKLVKKIGEKEWNVLVRNCKKNTFSCLDGWVDGKLQRLNQLGNWNQFWSNSNCILIKFFIRIWSRILTYRDEID